MSFESVLGSIELRRMVKSRQTVKLKKKQIDSQVSNSVYYSTVADLDSGIGSPVPLAGGPWEPTVGRTLTLIAESEASLQTGEQGGQEKVPQHQCLHLL